MTTPLTKEERGHLSADYLSLAYLRRYEATVRAVEAERDAQTTRLRNVTTAWKREMAEKHAAVARAEKLRGALEGSMNALFALRVGQPSARQDWILERAGEASDALRADDAERGDGS